jgi:hypothetical protein
MACGAVVLGLPVRAGEPAEASATRVENCVGSDAIDLRPGEDSAMLDAEDHRQFVAAMTARYPVLGRDGFAPTLTLLWRKPGAGWVYVALRPHADKPGRVCSLASFSAAAFELTPPLLRKYFVIAAGRT